MKANWYMVLIKGIVMILLAILVFNSPGGALLAYALYIGLGLLLTGIVMLFRGISLRKVNTNWGWTVFEGLLDIFLGYVLLANPLVTAAILPFIFGFWAVFYGALLLINSVSGSENKGMKIVSAILLILIGIMIMHNPLVVGMTVAIWVAILLLIVGIYNVIISFSLR